MEGPLSAEPGPLLQQTQRTGHSGNSCTRSSRGPTDQPNNNNTSNPLKYKKKRRRRRQSRKSDGSGKSNGRSSLDSSGGGGPSSRTSPTGRAKVPRSRAPATPARPLLRPVGTAVPRAPENSTTFIMDDHENSNLFYNFRNGDFSTPHWAKPTPLNSDDEEAAPSYSTPARPASEAAPAPSRRAKALGAVTPTYSAPGTPTHNTSWYPFNAEDFESAYQTAREDRLMAGSHTDLRHAISKLEARAAVLHDALSSSPSHILQKLQSQLLQLQEENRSLRVMANRRPRQQSTDRGSSSSSSSDSDSDSDSSDCSESDCDTCQARRSRADLREEEKENTCPREPNTCVEGEVTTSTTDGPHTEGGVLL